MTTLALAALLLSLPARAQDARADEYEARLTEVKGEVTVYTAEEPEGVPGEAEMPLETGDRVTTGEDASAEIGLDGAHAVSLRENGDFTLASPSRAGLELKLALGSLLAKVSALAAGQAFRVRTPTAVCAVRGTEFGVETAAEETSVGVFDEGRVEVEAGGAAEILKANEETSVVRGGRPALPTQLRRLTRHRVFMRGFRKRAQTIRKRWKTLAPAQRRELRRKMLGEQKIKRARRLEKQQQRRQGARRGGARPPRQDQMKMEKRREEIRRRRRP